ncbi:heme exporter protein CcmD [Variovorax sp. J31P207]|nr:heme exporter protein CcmD [Variovorax sp. J31P207]MDM0065181.1 heme exporter protein CcmD [Variovorax sp. J31P207]
MGWLTQISSGGHAAYVAAAFGFAFALLGAEILWLKRRCRTVSAGRGFS